MRRSLLSLFLALLSVLVVTWSPLAATAQLVVPKVGASVPIAGGAYPRSTLLKDGSIIVASTTKQGANAVISISRSTDGGHNFAPWGSVASAPLASTDLDNGELIQLADGSVLCAFRNHDRDPSNANNGYKYYRLSVSKSTDGGKTWSYLSQINQRPATAVKNGLWEPFFRIAKSGQLQAYYASENSDVDQDIEMQTSTDGGHSWGNVVTVAGAGILGRDGMPGCTDYKKNGRDMVMCIFETRIPGGALTFSVNSVTSSDDGASFSNRLPVYKPLGTNNNAGSPQIATTASNVLVAVFMTDEDTSLHNWPHGAAVKLLTSAPGQPWGNKIEVSSPSAYWPGIMSMPDGTVLVCNDGQCKSVSFSPAKGRRHGARLH